MRDLPGAILFFTFCLLQALRWFGVYTGDEVFLPSLGVVIALWVLVIFTRRTHHEVR